MTPQVKVESGPHSEAHIKVTFSEKDFAPYKEKAMQTLGKNVKVKGFRPGHVPKDVLEKQLNPEGVLGLAIDTAINESYKDAIMKEKIEILSRPEVKIDEADPLSYTAKVAVKPEATVKDYKKIKVKVEDVKVSDKDIKDTVQDLLKGKGTWHDVDRKAKDGDRAEIDFQGYDGTKVEKGKELENTQSKNHPLVLGSNSFVPGFEENVVGMKVGESKDFTVSFPKDYHVKDFQNKKVTFHVELKRLEEQQLPEYNDEFIKEATNGEKKDKKEFEAYVKEVLTQKKQDDAKGIAEAELIDKIEKATKVDFSDMLIRDEVEVMVNDLKKQTESRGIPFEKHLELTGQTLEDIKKGMEDEAKKRITMRFALDHIIKEEGFKATDKDVQAELAKIKARYPETEHAKIDEHYGEGTEGYVRLLNMLTVGKVFDMYLT